MSDLPAFQSWLAKGLGRAALFLKDHDATPYRDSLLHACTHNLTYDAQCEERRTLYLWNLIELSRDQAFFRNGVLQHLTERLHNHDEYEWGQIFGLARLFSAQGEAEMRNAMYSAFEHLGLETAGVSSAAEFVRLDGFDGFLFAVNRFEVTAPEDDLWQIISLMSELEDCIGKDQARELAAESARRDQRLASLLDIVREYERKAEEERSNAEIQPPANYLTLKTEQAHRSWASQLLRWANTPTQEQIEVAANDLLAETNAEKLRGYLRLFRRRSFPGNVERLLALADDERERIRRAAVIALSNVCHIDVRRRALALLQSADRFADGARLLVSNYESGDFAILEQLLLLEPVNPDTCHDLGFSIQFILERHLTADAEKSLLLLYEKNPCSNCREDFVRFLIDLQRLPDWIRLECQYDANPGTIQAVQPGTKAAALQLNVPAENS